MSRSPRLVMDRPRYAIYTLATRRSEGLLPEEHTAVAVARMLDRDGEGAIALEDRHSGHGGALIDPVYRIAPG